MTCVVFASDILDMTYLLFSLLQKQHNNDKYSRFCVCTFFAMQLFVLFLTLYDLVFDFESLLLLLMYVLISSSHWKYSQSFKNKRVYIYSFQLVLKIRQSWSAFSGVLEYGHTLRVNFSRVRVKRVKKIWITWK